MDRATGAAGLCHATDACPAGGASLVEVGLSVKKVNGKINTGFEVSR